MTRDRIPAHPLVSALLTALGLLGTAHAGTLHLRIPAPPTALLQPDAASLQAACDAGLQDALAGMAPATVIDGRPTRYSLNGTSAPTIMLITGAGSMQSRCHRASMDSRALIDARGKVSGTLWITVQGSTQTSLRMEATDWTVRLSVQDASGREVAHLNPTLVATGRAELWRSSCTAAKCVWTGVNRYGFDLGQLPAGVRATLKTAARVTVDVSLPVLEMLATSP